MADRHQDLGARLHPPRLELRDGRWVHPHLPGQGDLRPAAELACLLQADGIDHTGASRLASTSLRTRISRSSRPSTGASCIAAADVDRHTVAFAEVVGALMG
ncbi:MAG: hypothetical protein M3361_01520 [Candidatus Tectomicrobia bacterium]|nr:hypothetical protein [Candidatus Tectomicrobia bacterium]